MEWWSIFLGIDFWLVKRLQIQTQKAGVTPITGSETGQKAKEKNK
jgi:hypothetical protein